VSNSQSQILGSLFFLLEPVGLILIDLMVQKILIMVLLRYLNHQMTCRAVPTLGFTRTMILMGSLRSAHGIKAHVGKHRKAKNRLLAQGMLEAGLLISAAVLVSRRLAKKLRDARSSDQSPQ
jgi:hypothetical protein